MKLLVGYLVSTAVLALSACGAPAPVGGPAPAPPTDRYGAPDVENPRDVRPFAANPCTGLLTAAQLRDVGLATTGRQRTIVTNEQACTWIGETVDQRANIIVVPNDDILVGTYRARVDPVFEPTTIGGLPAVRERSGTADFDCGITVGTAEGQGFVIDFSDFDTGPRDPCGKALRVAEGVVANLPPLAKN